MMNHSVLTPSQHGLGWRLKIVTFVSGAALMGLEMAGGRVLAIHYGSSIYVWGSVIGTFLAALTFGYYIGGSLADRKPSLLLLTILILAAGCWLILIPLYADPVCRVIGRFRPGDRLGTLLATGLIFSGPSILMGIVCPFAIRLGAEKIEKLGYVAGRLYALSTLGSIVGTIVTAFWLIPSLGIRTVITSLGAMLILSALIMLPGMHKPRLISPLAVLAFIVALTNAYVDPGRMIWQLRRSQRVIFERDSAYHHIQVIDDPVRGARDLRFNNATEGSIDLHPPYGPRMRYIKAFHLSRVFKPDLKRVLVIGGGGASWPRELITSDPQVIIDVVEIDPVVIQVSRQYFYLSDNPRLTIFAEDGRQFVRRAKDNYDLIVIDAYTIGGQIPFHLTTQEFMREVRQILTPDGVVIANVAGALEGRYSKVFRAIFKTTTSVFDNHYLFPLLNATEQAGIETFAPQRGRNILIVAINGKTRWTKESITEKAQSLVSLTPQIVGDAQRLLDQKPRTD
ncbi:MAG TPA: fused MFS/spermidine synthase, partial [Blastocatellia bacterium]|nr:fused MFS/spermidine synthase [Blastocatellia bacterium]